MTIPVLGSRTSQYYRELSVEEIARVAGGGADDLPTSELDDVIVTGERDDDEEDQTDRWWLDHNWDDGTPPSGDSSGDGPGGGGDGDADTDTELSEEDKEDLKEVAEGLIAILEENIRKYGDFVMKLPNGQEVRASSLLDSLGKFADFIEAGTLAFEAGRGNADVGAIAGFFAGLLGGAVAGALGAGPLAVFAAGLAVGWSTEYIVDSIGQNLETALENAFAQQAAQNPGLTPGTSSLYFLMQMFGYTGPPPGGGTYVDGGDPGVYTGGGGTDPNYGGLYNIP